MADNLIDTGQLTPAQRDDFVSTVRTAALRDQFTMSLTMYAIVATR